jgi:hypothetical protein
MLNVMNVMKMKIALSPIIIIFRVGLRLGTRNWSRLTKSLSNAFDLPVESAIAAYINFAREHPIQSALLVQTRLDIIFDGRQ